MVLAEQNNQQKTQDINQLLKVRHEKLADLQANNKNPFEITKYDVSHHSQEIKDNYGELEDLKVNKRQEVAQKIKEAREQGDLSENAEYDAAKDEQRDIEARIEEIEKILKNAEVIVEEDVDVNKINIGCRVKILDLEYDEELVYKIVGSTEANSLKGKISNESPVGSALIGAKKGQTIEVETQVGVLRYKILEIQRSN